MELVPIKQLQLDAALKENARLKKWLEFYASIGPISQNDVGWEISKYATKALEGKDFDLKSIGTTEST